MKSVLITFDQAYYERIIATLDRLNCRGFTYWEQVRGRGSKTGDPHYGSHAWPSMCSAILTMAHGWPFTVTGMTRRFCLAGCEIVPA